VFAFHDDEEIGPKMLARIAKYTGLKRKICDPAPGAQQLSEVGDGQRSTRAIF